MAQKEVSVKLLINKNTNKVLFAEGNKDFVDFLFHILSLPVGAVVRLLNKEGMVNGLGNLYHSIENLRDDYIQPSFHKDSLLKPSRDATSVNGTVPLLSMADQAPESSLSKPARKYFVCSDINNNNRSFCNARSHWYVTDNEGELCPECRCRMSQELKFVEPADVIDEKLPSFDGYVKGVVTYLIMDDLVVKPMSVISIFALLKQFEINDLAALEEKVVHLGFEEGVALLKASLESKTVLTDTFLTKKASDHNNTYEELVRVI